jgi:hypothetical protein
VTPQRSRSRPAGARLLRWLAGLCASLTLLLAVTALAPTENAFATAVAMTGSHDHVAVVAAQHPGRGGLGLPARAPATSPAPGGPALEPLGDVAVDVAPPSAAGDAPVGRASRDRSPPVQQ